MSALAIATMVFVCTVVWGGLAAIVLLAARAEGRKERQRAARRD